MSDTPNSEGARVPHDPFEAGPIQGTLPPVNWGQFGHLTRPISGRSDEWAGRMDSNHPLLADVQNRDRDIAMQAKGAHTILNRSTNKVEWMRPAERRRELPGQGSLF